MPDDLGIGSATTIQLALFAETNQRAQTIRERVLSQSNFKQRQERTESVRHTRKVGGEGIERKTTQNEEGIQSDHKSRCELIDQTKARKKKGTDNVPICALFERRRCCSSVVANVSRMLLAMFR